MIYCTSIIAERMQSAAAAGGAAAAAGDGGASGGVCYLRNIKWDGLCVADVVRVLLYVTLHLY